MHLHVLERQLARYQSKPGFGENLYLLRPKGGSCYVDSVDQGHQIVTGCVVAYFMLPSLRGQQLAICGKFYLLLFGSLMYRIVRAVGGKESQLHQQACSLCESQFHSDLHIMLHTG